MDVYRTYRICARQEVARKYMYICFSIKSALINHPYVVSTFDDSLSWLMILLRKPDCLFL